MTDSPKRYGFTLVRAVAVAAAPLAGMIAVAGCADHDHHVTRASDREVYREPVVVAPPPARSDAVVTRDDTIRQRRVEPATYERPLEGQGSWINEPTYGRVWRPNNVAGDWRPYGNGNWEGSGVDRHFVAADNGPGWSNVTYQYGSWYDTPSYGWVWLPGSTAQATINNTNSNVSTAGTTSDKNTVPNPQIDQVTTESRIRDRAGQPALRPGDDRRAVTAGSQIPGSTDARTAGDARTGAGGDTTINNTNANVSGAASDSTTGIPAGSAAGTSTGIPAGSSTGTDTSTIRQRNDAGTSRAGNAVPANPGGAGSPNSTSTVPPVNSPNNGPGSVTNTGSGNHSGKTGPGVQPSGPGGQVGSSAASGGTNASQGGSNANRSGSNANQSGTSGSTGAAPSSGANTSSGSTGSGGSAGGGAASGGGSSGSSNGGSAGGGAASGGGSGGR